MAIFRVTFFVTIFANVLELMPTLRPTRVYACFELEKTSNPYNFVVVQEQYFALTNKNVLCLLCVLLLFVG
jgi:hypothetical protein